MRWRGTAARLVAVVTGSVLLASCGSDTPAATKSPGVALGSAPSSTSKDCGITLAQFRRLVGGTWRLGMPDAPGICTFMGTDMTVSVYRHRRNAANALYALRTTQTIDPRNLPCSPRTGGTRIVCAGKQQVVGDSYRSGVLTDVKTGGDSFGALTASEQRRLIAIVEKVIDA